MVQEISPFYESIHANIIVAIMNASFGQISIPSIVQHLSRFEFFNPAILYPFDFEDALLIWCNQCIFQYNQTTGAEMDEMDDLLSGLEDGSVFLMLMHHYLDSSLELSTDPHVNYACISSVCQRAGMKKPVWISTDLNKDPSRMPNKTHLKALMISFLVDLFKFVQQKPATLIVESTMYQTEDADSGDLELELEKNSNIQASYEESEQKNQSENESKISVHAEECLIDNSEVSLDDQEVVMTAEADDNKELNDESESCVDHTPRIHAIGPEGFEEEEDTFSKDTNHFLNQDEPYLNQDVSKADDDSNHDITLPTLNSTQYQLFPPIIDGSKEKNVETVVIQKEEDLKLPLLLQGHHGLVSVQIHHQEMYIYSEDADEEDDHGDNMPKIYELASDEDESVDNVINPKMIIESATNPMKEAAFEQLSNQIDRRTPPSFDLVDDNDDQMDAKELQNAPPNQTTDTIKISSNLAMLLFDDEDNALDSKTQEHYQEIPEATNSNLQLSHADEWEDVLDEESCARNDKPNEPVSESAWETEDEEVLEKFNRKHPKSRAASRRKPRNKISVSLSSHMAHIFPEAPPENTLVAASHSGSLEPMMTVSDPEIAVLETATKDENDIPENHGESDESKKGFVFYPLYENSPTQMRTFSRHSVSNKSQTNEPPKTPKPAVETPEPAKVTFLFY